MELYDAVQQLKRSQKDNKRMSAVLARLPSQAAAPGGGEVGGAGAAFKADAAFVVLEPSRISVADPSVCLPKELAVALDVRAFQVREEGAEWSSRGWGGSEWVVPSYYS